MARSLIGTVEHAPAGAEGEKQLFLQSSTHFGKTDTPKNLSNEVLRDEAYPFLRLVGLSTAGIWLLTWEIHTSMGGIGSYWDNVVNGFPEIKSPQFLYLRVSMISDVDGELCEA